MIGREPLFSIKDSEPKVTVFFYSWYLYNANLMSVDKLVHKQSFEMCTYYNIYMVQFAMIWKMWMPFQLFKILLSPNNVIFEKRVKNICERFRGSLTPW